eukprot:CAMPEP_0170563350 /NCGR_PEP_ID=MMETSP0211-20121228/66062_1 /TAXON_ID=311385 /ORGANISM="Pseudokeronopsis sp., Strain OXSARD2" /LENGTH=64 /DNA_ID=CAMNT_0010881483 /DNA_START=284 /DNA_END=478 /DNA_ORIENTATION=-
MNFGVLAGTPAGFFSIKGFNYWHKIKGAVAFIICTSMNSKKPTSSICFTQEFWVRMSTSSLLMS